MTEIIAANSAIPLFVTAVALVDGDGRVLVQQRSAHRSMAGLWEFPGGKVESCETPEAALVRELREELGIDTDSACLAPACFDSQALGGQDRKSVGEGKGWSGRGN